ncbi:MAG: hypothetical protein K5863_20970 [Nitratireductor sp.]|uniref:hypothetical protein n=1 Tax=Nitratireductor sp. TaxID=1872084 RepID=UPI0026262863|nr:hypothetical protein [Nitratireductor sp.]MCV0352558.1 hypothetical protein [Nitratireductor sp.]
MELHDLHSVADIGDGAFLVEVDITDIAGERYIADYCLVPGDDFGLAPTIRQAVEDWIDTGNVPTPHLPSSGPTLEDIRAAMPPLTARQLRLGLIANGVTLASVQAAIDGIADPVEREAAHVEWEYATAFERLHPLIEQIALALDLTLAEVDSMWLAAESL